MTVDIISWCNSQSWSHSIQTGRLRFIIKLASKYIAIFMWLMCFLYCVCTSGEYLSRHQKCGLCHATCYKCTGPESEDCISCSSTRWCMNHRWLDGGMVVMQENFVCCVGEGLSLSCLAGFSIRAAVWSDVILGSIRWMDSVVFATTRVLNVKMKDRIDVPAVAKVTQVIKHWQLGIEIMENLDASGYFKNVFF